MIAAIFLLLVVAGWSALAPAMNRTTVGPVPNIGQIGAVTRGQGEARYCRGIGLIDLGSAVDGPAYYFRRGDGRIIGRCGGFCWRQSERCRHECPPRGWECR